ncbi:MAG TPA: hypothetical protein VGY55_05125 [Pirellulales bacterium]|nr:hypothetical protein [Pirellulales bacterium]
MTGSCAGSKRYWRGAAVLAAIACLSSLAAVAAEPSDPLRLVPPSANFVVKIERPRAIADFAVKLASRPELEGFRGYRDYFESTNYHLFRQLVGHFERELGNDWANLLDELAGDGIVAAFKIEKNPPAPTLVIIQGRDPKLTEKFFRKAVGIVEQELARQGIHDAYLTETYRGIEVLHRGEDLHVALLGSAIALSNVRERLHSAIDLYLDPSKESLLKKKTLVDARAYVPTDALAWTWMDLETAHKNPELQPLFTLPANFFPIHVAFGGLIDSLRRSPFLVAAVREDHGTATLSLRLPGGSAGMHDLVRGHVPPDRQPGAQPLLAPAGTLYSASYYLDVASFWKQRAVLLPKDQLKRIEEFDKNSKLILYGTQFSQFLEYAGARQRFVVAQQEEKGYSIKPEDRQPAFALVLQMRDPDAFAKAVDGPLRGLAFLAGLKAPMSQFIEEHGESKSKIIGYRFVENDGNKALGDGILFNFSPSRVRVGNQYVLSSTVELARQLVDELEKEANSREQTVSQSASTADGTILQSRLSFSGVSNYLGAAKKQLITQNMLEQGNSPEEAEKEVSLFLQLLDHLGRVETTNRYTPDQYQFDLRISP